MVLNRTHSSTEGLREGSLSSCTGRLCQAGGNSVNRDRSLCVLLLGCLCLESISGLASQRALDKLLTGYVTRSTYWQTSSKELHRSWLLTNTLHDPVADIWRQPHRTQSIPKELTIYRMSKIRLVQKKQRGVLGHPSQSSPQGNFPPSFFFVLSTVILQKPCFLSFCHLFLWCSSLQVPLDYLFMRW